MSGVDLDSVDLDARIIAADRGEPSPQASAPAGALEVSLQDPADALEAGLWVAAFVQWRELVCAFLPDKCAVKLTEDRAARIGAAFAKGAKHQGWKFAAIFANPWGGVIAESFPVAEPVVMPWIKNAMVKKPSPAAAPSTDAPADATQAVAPS